MDGAKVFYTEASECIIVKGKVDEFQNTGVV